MSGHSKWSTIKHKKGAADARRGKIFTKLIKEITTAARTGGADTEANPRLRVAVLKAKSENMTKENIERAIKRGTAGPGEGGVSYEEYTYEGYGPGGTAILVETLTDNKNRTTAEIRHIFSRYNGNLGESGSVSWIFSKKGYLSFERQTADEDRIMELALEAGADDVREDEDAIEVITESTAFETVKKVFDDNGLKYQIGQIDMIPQTSIKLEGKSAETMLKLMEALEDSDDVQEVHANFDISSSEMERLSQ
jgi:YebC/PmpR family DNA-binding regulatory protein